jgi:hypothetical protein
LVRRFHANSRESVIRKFLQMRVGEACQEIKLRESERILRAQWFVQDARVLVYPDSGGVQLIVTSVDEVAVILDGKLGGRVLKGATVGTTNLMGRGLLIETGWRDNGGLRDGRSLRLRSAVTFGEPIQTNFYPFLTDLQRYGFRAVIGRDADYVQYRRAAGEEPLQVVTHSFGSIGGVARIGRPGALLLAGASISHDDESVGRAVVITDSGARPFGGTLPPLPRPRASTRLNFLFGGRAMRFLPAEGFDALTGVQDLRLGVQFGGQVGSPIKLSGLRSDQVVVAGDVYAGWGSQKAFAATEWIFSGVRSGQGSDGGLVTGRTALYVKPSKQATTIASVEYVGGDEVRVPYQIALGATRTGLRGFRKSRDGGASRMLIRGEQRQAIGRPYGFADVGVAAFAETGRVYAGSAPFGVTTPWRTSIGTSLLLSVPPRSRRMFRVDLAWAVNPDARSRRFEVRLESGNFTRFFWQDPDESRRARERSVVTNIFAF